METIDPQSKRVLYDYNSAWMLYVMGATTEEAALASNIPLEILKVYSARKGWRQKRAQAKQYASRALKEQLTQRIEEHRVKHQHFILDTLEETQRKLQDADIVLKKKKDEELGDNQLTLQQTLSLTKEHDELARRTLGLDEEQKQDPMAFGFAILKAMRGGENTPSAPYPLPEDSDAFTGILRPFNGHSNGLSIVDIEAQTTQSERTGPQETVEPTQQEMGYKPLPTKITFTTPQPLVNERPDGQEPSKD
jgi:hypothetical protein